MQEPALPAPAWGVALGQIGVGLVWLSIALYILSAALPWIRRDHPLGEKLAKGAFWGASVSLFSVFALLFTLFLNNQYQFRYVFGHSQRDYELQYKIAGVWAGQEGSILLWSCLTALFGLLTIGKFGVYTKWYRTVYAALLALMTGISAFESPFKLLVDAGGHAIMAPDGRGMPPSLLNYWMVIHPPTIFVGFALTAVAYSLSMAALAHRDLSAWIPMVRPWALTCLGVLGLGLCMGGFWAYETLGWGGFWVWDPVENTSFVPWCALAAFTHGIIVQQARNKWHMTNAILGAFPFLLFCYGTFLTRSGFLGDTSVHSFAKMDPQALGILIGLIGVTFLGFGATLMSAQKWWKSAKPKTDAMYEKKVWNKSSFYGTAMWLLFAFGLVTAIGMSVPLLQSLLGQKPKVVEESLYNQVLGWFFVPSMLLIGLAPFATWRGEGLKGLVSKILNPLALAIMFTGFVLLWSKWGWAGEVADASLTTSLAGVISVPRTGWVSFLAFLCFFAIFSNIFKLWDMVPRARKTLGGVLTHVGVGMALLGLVVSRGLEQKKLVTVHPNKAAEAFGYQINYVGPTKSFTDRNNEVKLNLSGARGQFVAHPGLYFKPGEDGPQPTIWPHIERKPLYDLYLTLHPMVWEATEAQGLEKDQQARFDNVIVTYRGLRTEGQLGTKSAKFIADTDVQVLGSPVTLSPSILLGSNGSSPRPAAVDEKRILTLMKADVDTGTIVLRLSTSPDRSLSLAQGASIVVEDLRLTFKQMRPEGASDPTKARLIADIIVEPILSTKRLSPWMSMSGEQKVRLNSDYELALERIDAGTKAAFYRFDYVQPAYPVEVFYKPLTWMVWFGVGIMTLGALWSARGRRVSQSSPSRESGQDTAPEPAEEVEKVHETVSTP